MLTHPYFWPPASRLSFLQDVSDRFEVEPKEPPSPLLIRLEQNAHLVVGPDWYKRIDKSLLDNLGKYRKYDGASVRDLLRALRNKVLEPTIFDSVLYGSEVNSWNQNLVKCANTKDLRRLTSP